MKKIFALMAAAVAGAIFVLPACTQQQSQGQDAHEHIFPSAYNSDDARHWQECIGEGCDETQNAGEHQWAADAGGTDATCEQAGTRTYTCSVCGRKRGADPALGHDFGAAEYVWADDNGSVTATRSCRRAGCGEVESETVAARSQVTQLHSCEPPLAAVTTWTSQAFANPAFAVQEKRVEGAAAGHDYSAYDFDEEGHWPICSHCGKAEPDVPPAAHEPDAQGLCVCGHAQAISVSEGKKVTDPDKVFYVRGIVVGATGNYDGGYSWLLIKDENSNEITGIRKRLASEGGESTLAGGYSYAPTIPFELGDIVSLPVSAKQNTAANGQGGEHGKVHFIWQGENFKTGNAAELVARYKIGHTDDYLLDKSQVTVVIDSQEDLESFVTTPGFQWQLVCLRGTEQSPLKAVTGAATSAGKGNLGRSYIRFFYDSPSNLDEQKVNKASPALSNFGNTFNLSDYLSSLLFGETEYTEKPYLEPYSYVGDIYCLIIGGSTAYYHFIVPDESCIVPASAQ